MKRPVKMDTDTRFICHNLKLYGLCSLHIVSFHINRRWHNVLTDNPYTGIHWNSRICMKTRFFAALFSVRALRSESKAIMRGHGLHVALFSVRAMITDFPFKL